MATFVDLRRMLANDPRLTSVFLTFSSRLDCEDFRRAINTNTAIEEVVISADESSFQECPEGRLEDILKALGRLPRLRKLSINSYPNCRGTVSMKDINHIISGAKELQILGISDLQVTGLPQDFASFAEHLQQMFFLKTFCWTGCNLFVEDDSAPSTTSSGPSSMSRKSLPLSSSTSLDRAQCPPLLDPLFLGLSMLPSLQVVSIAPHEQGGLGNLSVPAVTSLCFSASIRLLRLRKLDLSAAHVSSMACLLEMNTTLESLDLGCLKDGAMDSTTASALGRTIQNNQTLQHLELVLDTMLSDTSAEVLAKALQHNRHLRSFALTTQNPKTVGRVTPKVRRVMLQMIQYNYTLEKFFLFRKYPLSREFKLYARLNQLGRGKLLSSTGAADNSSQAWVDKLASPEVNSDLNAIFYFVSCNPTLCMTKTTTKASGKRQTEEAVATSDTRRPCKKQRSH